MTDEVTSTTPLPWYKSGRIRVALTTYVPTAVFMLKITHIGKRLGIDFDDFATNQIVDAALAVGGVATGTYFIIKRRIDGLNHRNLAQPIVGPIAQVKRMTGVTPVIK